MTDLNAVRERDAQSAETWFRKPDSATARAIQDRRALLSLLYERDKQRALDAEEIRRLRAAIAALRAADDGEWINGKNLPRFFNALEGCYAATRGDPPQD